MTLEDKLKNVDLEKFTTKQLEKIKAGLLKEKASFAPKINVLDKFTNIDELLIENTIATRDSIIEQRETNRQMRISNRLILALLVEELEDGTVIRKDVSGIDTDKILESIGKGGGRTTIVKSLPNFSGNKTVFELSDSGFVIEIMFKSSTSSTDNKDYSVRVSADNTIIYQDSFATFESHNKFERDMTCYEDTRDSYYFLQFKNISYKNKFVVEIYESEATFEQVYIKYLEG